MTFEEWWSEHYSGPANGWEADIIRTGWNAALQNTKERSHSGEAPTDNKPLCASGDAKLPSFEFEEVFCDFCKAYKSDAPAFYKEGFLKFYDFLIYKLGNLTTKSRNAATEAGHDAGQLQQLKTEILALRKDDVVADDMYWIGWNMALERAAGVISERKYCPHQVGYGLETQIKTGAKKRQAIV